MPGTEYTLERYLLTQQRWEENAKMFSSVVIILEYIQTLTYYTHETNIRLYVNYASVEMHKVVPCSID